MKQLTELEIGLLESAAAARRLVRENLSLEGLGKLTTLLGKTAELFDSIKVEYCSECSNHGGSSCYSCCQDAHLPPTWFLQKEKKS